MLVENTDFRHIGPVSAKIIAVGIGEADFGNLVSITPIDIAIFVGGDFFYRVIGVNGFAFGIEPGDKLF